MSKASVFLTQQGFTVSDPPTEAELTGIARQLGLLVLPTTTAEGMMRNITSCLGLSAEEIAQLFPKTTTQPEGVSDMNTNGIKDISFGDKPEHVSLTDWLAYCHAENIAVPEGIHRPSFLETMIGRFNPFGLLRR